MIQNVTKSNDQNDVTLVCDDKIELKESSESCSKKLEYDKDGQQYQH